MTYFDLTYAFLFLPITMIVYSITPKKFRYIILLIASLVFFALISNKLIIFLLATIVSIYFGARWLTRINKKQEEALETALKDDRKAIKAKFKKQKRLVLLGVILFNVAFLFFYKYLKFFLINTNIVLKWLDVDYKFKILKYVAPVGISYYTLQAISYITDVYNDKIAAEKNILKLALFMSFFPQIMEGPIVKFHDTAEKLAEGLKITFHNLSFGYQRIAFGFFKKFVIADRLNLLVKTVFAHYTNYSGISCWLAVIGYMVMLYAEFSGTMDIVIGTGEIFGVTIPENFRQPFFAKNISEFWARWHISLGTWFKDYIFYPVSLSKPMKKITTTARKVLGPHYGALISGSVALLVVWLLNGLWHGAGWNYIFFGLYHFVMILLGGIIEPIVVKVCEKHNINRKNIFYRCLQTIKLWFVVFVGELFFRAPTVAMGFKMLKKMFTNFSLGPGEIASLGLDIADYIILIIAIIFLFIIGILKEKGINIREKIAEKKIFVRWIIYYALILSVITFGAYGPGYAPVDPIYADF